jgi:hypothetical protein
MEDDLTLLYTIVCRICAYHSYSKYTSDHLAHVKNSLQYVCTVNAMRFFLKNMSARHSHSNGYSSQACVTWEEVHY